MNNGKNGGKRRKQHGRAPSNQRRRRRANKHKIPPSNDSIEEQLRAQRKRQALEHKSEKNKPQEQPSASLGNYRYDAERNTYFPADSFSGSSKKRPAKSSNKSVQQQRYVPCAHPKCLLNPSSISSQSLQYSMEVSTYATRQYHLRSLLAARLLKQGMQVVPTCLSLEFSPEIDGQTLQLWSMLPRLATLYPSSNDSSLALDLVCKTRLHPSARTFDIHYDPAAPNQLPSIVTLVNGGLQVTYGHEPQLWQIGVNEPRVNDDDCLRISPQANSGESEPHAIRFAPNVIQAPDNYLFCNLSRLSSQPNKSVVRCWRGRDNRISHTDLTVDFVANDLVYSSHDINMVGVAPNCVGRQGSRMALLDLEAGVCFNYSQDAPRSDALCIEHVESTFLTGHRNSCISMVDTRSGVVRTFCSPDQSAGSLTRILSIENDPTKILAKHSFGHCFLWDVRMMRKDEKSTPLLHLRVPKSLIQPTKSSCCNGVAVDPTGSIAVAPFVLNSKEQTTCLAFWSLASGSFVGYKLIVEGSGADGMPHCELASTITSAWKPLAQSPVRNVMTVEPNENAWGLWFKYQLPMTREHSMPKYVSSIHHVTFPGRVMDNPESGMEETHADNAMSQSWATASS